MQYIEYYFGTIKDRIIVIIERRRTNGNSCMYGIAFNISNHISQSQTDELYLCDVDGRKQLSNTGERRCRKVGKKGIRQVV